MSNQIYFCDLESGQFFKWIGGKYSSLKDKIYLKISKKPKIKNGLEISYYINVESWNIEYATESDQNQPVVLVNGCIKYG